MKTVKEEYTAPKAEVIEMEAENVIATSPGADDNNDPGIQSAPSKRLFDRD